MYAAKDDVMNEVYADKTYEDIQETILEHTRQMIQPAYNYLHNVIMVKMASFFQMFHLACLINPFYVRDEKPSSNNYLEWIPSLNYFDAEAVTAMVDEVQAYEVLVTRLPERRHALPRGNIFDTRSDNMKDHYEAIMKESITFWRTYEDKLPNLYKLFHHMITLSSSLSS
jgi:hypothetical protein